MKILSGQNAMVVYDFPDAIKRPTILFLHGIGERGDGSDIGLNALKSFIDSEWNNINKALNTSFDYNGKQEQFALIAPQLPSTQGEWQNSYIDNAYKYAIAQPYVDPSRITIIGVSLGGGGLLKYLSVLGNGAKFNCGIAICPAYASGIDYKVIAESKCPLLFFHAQNDNVVSVSVTNSAVSGINQYNPPIPATKIIYTDGGHYIWGNAFDPSKTPNIYLWMLMNTNTVHKAIPGTSATTTTSIPAGATLKAIAEVTNLTPTTATLDGSKSEGKINWSVFEMVLPSPLIHPNVFPNWQKGGPVINLINLKPNTDYQFKYTVNGTSTTLVNFKTPATAKAPIMVESDIPPGKTHVIVREDKTIEFI